MNEDIASCIAGFLGEETWSATRLSSGRTSGATVSIGDVTSGSHPQPTPISSLHGIAFSKDRPFQLCHMIETYLENSGLLYHQGRDYDTGPVLSVIYKFTNGEVEFEKAYAALQERFSPLGVSFLREEETEGGFSTQLRKCLENLPPKVHFITFLVDDMVFFEPIPIKSALTMLFARLDVLCIHLKLHPGVMHTHSAGGLPCVRPTFKIALIGDSDNESMLSDNMAQNTGSTLLVFPHSQGTGDWDYSWDLTGGIYRRQHVIEMLDIICETYGPTATSTPNLLESNGATLLRASRNIHESGEEPLVSWPQLEACPIRPVCAALTINRVQTDFPLTPIYNTEGGGIKELQNMMDVGRRLDLKKYRSIAVAYSSVHVGDLFLLPICEDDGKTGLLMEERDVEEENVLEEDDDLPLVSVIIPVHNGGVHLQQSVRSVLLQTMRKIEVFVLDDGSTDGCVDLMLENEEISGDHRLRLKRFQTAGGLVKALNTGIQLARAEYVARLDADDVMARDRLQRQYAFLCHDTCSNVAVVGTGVLTFSGGEEDKGNGKGKLQEVIQRVVSHPTLPALLQWSLFFSCCVAHPAVMMRRTPVLDIGGYREEAFPAEDYDLWLRMSSSSSNVVVNLGEPLTLLRKHPKSLSVQHQTAQAAMALGVAHRAIEILLGRPVSLLYVAAMRQHQKDSTATVSDLHGAAELMVELAGVILSQFEKRDAVGIFYNPADIIAVKHDLRARLLELAQVCLVRFGSAASAVLRLLHQVEASMAQNEYQ